MSNYHSIIHNYGQPQSTFDANLAVQALSYKQGKYDANAAKIQEALNTYGNIELARPEDREYLYQRLNSLVNNIKGLKGADLASNNVTSQIMGHVSKALDERVIKQYGNTQKIKNFQANLAELQKKDPNAISNTNYQDAIKRAGLEGYMGEETDDLGDLSYTPYHDPTQDLLKKIKGVKDVMGKQEIQLPDPNDPTMMRKVTTDNMTVAEWAQYMPQIISQQNRDQFAIDGRAAFGWNDEAAVTALEQSKQTLIEPLDSKIKSLRATLETSDLDPASKEKAQRDIEIFTQEKKKIESRLDGLDKTATGIGGFFQEQNIINNLSQMIGSEPSIILSKNQAYFDGLKLAEEEAKRQGNIMGTDLLVTSLPTDTSQTIDLDKGYEKRMAETKNFYKQSVNNTYRDLVNANPALKSKIDETVLTIKQENPNLSDIDARMQAILKHTDDPNIQYGLKTAQQGVERMVNAQQVAMEKTSSQTFEEYGEIYESLIEPSNIKVLAGDKPVAIHDYLKSQGVYDAEDFRAFIEDPEKSREFKSQMYADTFLSNITFNSATNISKEHVFYFNRIASELGEKGLKITDVYDVQEAYNAGVIEGKLVKNPNAPLVTEEQLIENLEKKQYFLTPKREHSTKTGKLIEDLIGTGVSSSKRGIQLFTRDRSFSEDRTLKEKLSFKKNQENYQNNLKQEAGRVGVRGMNVISLSMPLTTKDATASIEYNELSMATSNTSNPERFELQIGKPVRIIRMPETEQIFIAQYEDFKSAKILDETGKPRIGAENTAVISERDFRALAPNLSSRMDFREVGDQLKFDENVNLNVPKITYSANGDTTLRKNYEFFGNARIGNLTTLSSTKRVMQDELRHLYQDGGRNQYAQTLEKALNNHNSFSLDYVSRGEGTYVSLKLKGKEVKQIPISALRLDPTTTHKAITVAPQVFLSAALLMIGEEVQKGDNESFSILLNNL